MRPSLGSIRARISVIGVRAFFFWGALFALVSGCASSDSGRLRQSRELYLNGDYAGAENLLYSKEVLVQSQSRLQHYLWLGSVAMSQGIFEKALFYLERARDLALALRSDRAGFNFFDKDYGSNPVEFSHLHGFLVLANLILAESGETPAWSIPELKLPNGTLLFPAQGFSARRYTPAEVANFRTKARAELMAWDQFLTLLKRTYPDPNFYQEDLFARILGAFVHGGSATSQERRTGELLALRAKEILPDLAGGLPTLKSGESGLSGLLDRLASRAREKDAKPGSLFLVDAGVMPVYSKKRIVIGLSLLFKSIDDPMLRAQLEQIGFRMLLQFAPEFGLVAFTGAMAGAASASGTDDSPLYLTDAVDRGMGFEFAFPMVSAPDPVISATLALSDSSSHRSTEVPLLVLNPVQEVLAHELKTRMDQEWSKKAMKVGLQYLAVLVPAVIAYRDADQSGNFLKKLAVIAGYMLAKAGIDRANEPDTRSWSLLPRLWFGDHLTVAPGVYSGKLTVRHSHGEQVFDLGGGMRLSEGVNQVIYRKIGEIQGYSPGAGSGRGIRNP